MNSFEEKMGREKIISTGLIQKFFTGDFKTNGATYYFEFRGEKFRFEQDELFERVAKILNSIIKHYMPNIFEDRYDENHKYRTNKHEYTYLVSNESNSGETTDFKYSIPILYLAKAIRQIVAIGNDGIKGQFISSCIKIWNGELKPKFEEKDMYEMILHTLDGTVDQVSIVLDVGGEINKKKQEQARKTFYPNHLDKVIILGNFISKEEFEKRKFEFMCQIVTDEKLTKQLIKEGFIKPEDITDTLSQDLLVSYIQVFKDRCKFLAKYLDTEHLFDVCKQNLVPLKELASHPIQEVLSCASKELDQSQMAAFIMDIKNYYDASIVQDSVWQLFEDGYLDRKYMNYFNSKNVVRADKAVRVYLNNMDRKIRSEIRGTKVSLSKLREFLDPHMIINIVESNATSQREKKFISGEFKTYCLEQGSSLDEEILLYVKSQEEKGAKASRVGLYTSGLVDLEYFDDGDISESDLMKLYQESKNDNIIIDGFNCGIIDGTTVYETVDMDNNRLCKMIHESGLNPSVLTELFSTYEILKLCGSEIGGLSISDLHGINFNIDEIIKLYGEMKLPLILLNDLESANVLTSEQAKKIKNSYDANKDFDKLVEQGAVYGLDDIQRARELNPMEFDTGDKHSSNNTTKQHPSILPDRIGYDLREQILDYLGADDRILPVVGELFEDYYLYTLLDKGVAVIEPLGGRAYTFVMPLRMVLDQVFGKGILQTARYKKELIYDPSIRPIKHTARYGRSLTEAVCDLCDEYKEQKPLRKDKNLKSIILQIAESYKSYAKEENEIIEDDSLDLDD